MPLRSAPMMARRHLRAQRVWRRAAYDAQALRHDANMRWENIYTLLLAQGKVRCRKGAVGEDRLRYDDKDALLLRAARVMLAR